MTGAGGGLDQYPPPHHHHHHRSPQHHQCYVHRRAARTLPALPCPLLPLTCYNTFSQPQHTPAARPSLPQPVITPPAAGGHTGDPAHDHREKPGLLTFTPYTPPAPSPPHHFDPSSTWPPGSTWCYESPQPPRWHTVTTGDLPGARSSYALHDVCTAQHVQHCTYTQGSGQARDYRRGWYTGIVYQGSGGGKGLMVFLQGLKEQITTPGDLGWFPGQQYLGCG